MEAPNMINNIKSCYTLFITLDNYVYMVEVHTCKNYPSVELIGHFLTI